MAPEQIFFYFIVFVYGITIGSFLNVCIYRIPKEESIVTVGSHCMKCWHRLKWYDLIPVFSWLFLKGKCRYCGTRVSVQYPLVELANGILYIVVFAANGWNIESGLWCIMTSALLVLSVIDYRTMMIPTGVDFVILIVGILHLVLKLNNWHYYVIGFFFASLFLLLCSIIFRMLRGKRGLGLGDIELMACTGLCIGWGHALFAVILGSLIGSVIQGIKIAVTKEGQKFAFGPYLSAGVFIAMLWGSKIYDWYVGTFLYG